MKIPIHVHGDIVRIIPTAFSEDDIYADHRDIVALLEKKNPELLVELVKEINDEKR